MSYSNAINSVIITADIVLSAKDGSGSQTLKISSAEIEAFSDSTFDPHYPILNAINGLTQDHTQFIPVTSSAQISINNKEQSLGFQRRFSDLLNDYTVLEQDCTINIYLKSHNGTTASLSESFVYKMQGVEIDLANGLCVLNLKNNPLSEKIISKEINTTDFPNAYTSSIGKYLPVVFGEDAKVLCERLGNATYGYATNFGSSYYCSTPSQYFIKSLDGEYREINFASTTSTAVLGNSLGSVDGVGTIYLEEIPSWGVGFELQDFTNNENGYLVDRGRMYFKGTGFTPSGQLVFEILEGNFTSFGSRVRVPPPKVLGTAIVDKDDYSSEFAGTSEFWIDFTFNDPVIIGKDQDVSLSYYLTVKDSDISVSIDYVNYNLSSGTIKHIYFSDYDNAWYSSNNGIGTANNEVGVTNSDTARFEFYGATVTDETSTVEDDKGLGYHAFSIDTGTSTNNLDKYQFGVTVDGLGTTTSPDTTAPTIIKNVLSETGSLYLDSGFDDDWTEAFTAFSRSISGALVGKVTLSRAIEELCRNSACRLYSVTTGGSIGLDIKAWGAEQDVDYYLNENELRTNAVTISDRSLVINNITANYGVNPVLSNTDLLIRAGIRTGFSKIISNYRRTSTDSIDLYDINDLSDSSFPLVNDETSMQNVAEYFLRFFEHPPIYAQITLPYTNRAFQAGNIISVLTPKLPAYYGTSSNPLPATYQGDIVTLNSGNDQTRAKLYYGLIESKSVQMDTEKQITVSLRLRLIDKNLKVFVNG